MHSLSLICWHYTSFSFHRYFCHIRWAFVSSPTSHFFASYDTQYDPQFGQFDILCSSPSSLVIISSAQFSHSRKREHLHSIKDVSNTLLIFESLFIHTLPTNFPHTRSRNTPFTSILQTQILIPHVTVQTYKLSAPSAL